MQMLPQSISLDMDSLLAEKYFILLLSTADFLQNQLYPNSFRNTIRVSKGLYPDQDQHFVGPDLDTYLLTKFIIRHKSRL